MPISPATINYFRTGVPLIGHPIAGRCSPFGPNANKKGKHEAGSLTMRPALLVPRSRLRGATVADPVATGQRGSIVARRADVEDGQHLVGLLAERLLVETKGLGIIRPARTRSRWCTECYLEVDVGVSAEAFARGKRQVAQKIARVQPRQRQSVSVACSNTKRDGNGH